MVYDGVPGGVGEPRRRRDRRRDKADERACEGSARERDRVRAVEVRERERGDEEEAEGEWGGDKLQLLRADGGDGRRGAIEGGRREKRRGEEREAATAIPAGGERGNKRRRTEDEVELQREVAPAGDDRGTGREVCRGVEKSDWAHGGGGSRRIHAVGLSAGGDRAGEGGRDSKRRRGRGH